MADKQRQNQPRMERVYRRIAGGYDASLWLFEVFGFRLRQWRYRAVASLHLRRGGTVVDLGCGTGLNMPYLSIAAGESGRVIGVDLTAAMLERARTRIEEEELHNVDLVRTDMSEWQFPDRIDGVLSTLALSIPADYDRIIERAAQALRPGARMAFVELKRPERWPEWLARLGVKLLSIYGTQWEHTEHKPWLAARRHLTELRFEEFYFGVGYLWVGERPATSSEGSS